MKSLANGALAENPLRTVFKDLPPQVIFGAAIESAQTVSSILKNFGLSSSAGNIVAKMVLSGSLGQMWTMVNSLQILLS